MAYQGLTNQYGTIPDDIWMRKHEVTNMDDDPMLMENHLRNLLVDQRPDRPFLESDQPRGSNIPGSGFMSEQILNLRHSMALTSTSPYLPDGTFLDHVFLERDPRSTATDPDFEQYAKQSYARANFTNYYPDEDWSVSERGINPVQMVANINSGFYPAKDRQQIFEESFDNFNLTSTAPRAKFESARAKTTTDGTIPDLTDVSYLNRRDAVSRLSNDPLMAYRYTVPDQRVKVARYGNTRISQTLDTQDWNANRAAAYVNRDIGVIVNNERVNKAMAEVIINLEGIRDTKQMAFQGAQYNDSAVVQNLQSRVPVDVLNEILQYSENSQTDPANMHFESSFVTRHADRQPHDRMDHGKSEFNHVMIESMVGANTQAKDRNIDDLRNEIEQTASDQGIYVDVSNRTYIDKADRRKQIEEHQMGTHAIEDSKTIASYKSAPRLREQKMSRQQFEAYKAMSQSANNRRLGANKGDLIQNVKKYGETPLYDERQEVFVQQHGSMKDKGRVLYNSDSGETAVNERDLAKFGTPAI